MIKKSCLHIFLLLCFGFGFGQTKDIDSLRNVLSKISSTDSIKVDAYLALTKSFLPVNIDSTIKYSKIGLKKALLTNNYRIVRAYSNRGLGHYNKAQLDSARFFYDKALEELDKNENKIERSTVYANYALTYQNSEQIDYALDYNIKAIDLVKDNHAEVCLIYFNQAAIYLRNDLNDVGKKFFKLAYESSKIAKDYRVEGASLSAIGYVFVKEKQLDSAKLYLEKGLELCERTKSPETCFRMNMLLGELYVDMGLYTKAHKAITDAKNFADTRNLRNDVLSSLYQLGQIENYRENYNASTAYFKQFESAFKSAGDENLRLSMDAYRTWSDTEAKLKNYKKANALLEQHLSLKDSVYKIENQELLTNADAKYESEKKDKELVEQKLELAENKSKNRTMNMVIACLLLGSILLWFSFRQRQKRMQQQLVAIEREQEVRTLESLIEGEEKERLRIAKELHDGVSGDLAAIKFKLSSLLETNNNVINEAVAMIDLSSEQVRAISHNLVPPSLRDFNLLEAVDTYCENMNGIHDPEISFQHLGNEIRLEKKQEANLFRIIQELVTNSIKHANAKEIHVQLSNIEDNLQLTVEDDGKGFDVNNIERSGIRMQNVKSRVEYLSGLMDIKSDSKGTSFTITITDKQEKA